MVSLCQINYSEPVHSGWGDGLDPTGTDDYNTPWNDDSEQPEVETDFDPASITVQMSIWQELCAGQRTDERQVSCITSLIGKP